jgi:hypothetical protein
MLPILLGNVAPIFAQEATPIAPSAEITTEELARVQLPADALPPLPAVVDVWLWRLIPRQELRVAADELPPSIAGDVVLRAAYTIRSEGRLQVQRGAGLEEVPPGTEITLQAGDVDLFVDNQAAQMGRNAGAGEGASDQDRGTGYGTRAGDRRDTDRGRETGRQSRDRTE